jgi:hypothetical protein
VKAISPNRDRRSQQRKNVREKLLNDLRKLVGHKGSQDHLRQGGENDEENGGAENPIRTITSIGTAVSDGSFFSSKKQSQAFSFICCPSNDYFVSQLYHIWSKNDLTVSI